MQLQCTCARRAPPSGKIKVTSSLTAKAYIAARQAASDLPANADPTKVTPWSLGQTMSMFVPLECHLWLNIAEMREADKKQLKKKRERKKKEQFPCSLCRDGNEPLASSYPAAAHLEPHTGQHGAFHGCEDSSPATDRFLSGFTEQDRCSRTPTSTRSGPTASWHDGHCSASPPYHRYDKNGYLSGTSGSEFGSLASSSQPIVVDH